MDIFNIHPYIMMINEGVIFFKMNSERMTAEEMIKEGVSFDRILTVAYNEKDFTFKNCSLTVKEQKDEHKFVFTYKSIEDGKEYEVIKEPKDDEKLRKYKKCVKYPQNLYAAIVIFNEGTFHEKVHTVSVYEKGNQTKGVYRLLVKIVDKYMQFKQIFTKDDMLKYVEKFEENARKVQAIRADSLHEKWMDEFL